MTAFSSQQTIDLPSSSLSSLPSSDTILKENSQSLKLPHYRRARELPFQLASNVQTYYEESLFTGAFNFLISIVSNSISASNYTLPVIIPKPDHLSVAATLAVHPLLTTRTIIREKWDQANAAFRLLKLVLHAVGPVESKLSKAFEFTKFDTRSSIKREKDANGYGNGKDDESSRLNIRYAETDSVWSRAEDFWQIVGWAFNCSCLPNMHASRWQHWQLFLEFMIDVLERDWELHYHNSTSEESLMWQYIELASGGHGRSRRIMRAIFADGSTRSLAEFREVFHNELKPPSPKETGIKKRQVDVKVDKEVFGDYLDASSSDISDSDTTTNPPNKRARTRTPSARRTSSRASSRTSSHSSLDDTSTTNPSTPLTLGPPPSLNLRLRLLHLLSHISLHPTLTSTSPTTFPDLDELYTLFVEWIKPLPLPLFTAILLPSTPTNTCFSTDAHTTLLEFILQRSLESAAPAIRSEKYLTRDKLVEQYLPYAAAGAGVVEQAKVGLLLEALVRRGVEVGLFAGREGEKGVLREVVERGRKRRELMAWEGGGDGGAEGRKKKKKAAVAGEGVDVRRTEKEAWRWLRESGKRMALVVELLE